MKFRIKDGYDDFPKRMPFSGCVKGKFSRLDKRNTDDPKKIPAFKGKDGDWYKVGHSHSVINGEIQRYYDPIDCWYFETNNIEDLNVILEERGEFKIETENYGESYVIDIPSTDRY